MKSGIHPAYRKVLFVDGATGDQVGTTAAPIDAKLGPLADNGGPTATHALLPGSPAIDSGESGCPGFAIVTQDSRIITMLVAP